jgi:hypothetical protein
MEEKRRREKISEMNNAVNECKRITEGTQEIKVSKVRE